ncbi:hypothetical protein LCGC14_1869520 [marine sediment metagenome]|uniref:Uncharacterized protein n=1 Tax=marine sediment metagenome TaxID=412755 RepID=A0A0F9IJG6_9ZZZZ
MPISNVLGSLAQKFEGYYEEAKTANLERYAEAKNIYEENVAQYAPGGGFGAGYEAQLTQAKRGDVGTQMQHQISSGLYGVQTTGALGQQWESKVGAPARLQLEDLRRERYTGAQKDLAGVIERREDEYPDFSLIANLYERAAAAQTSQMRLPPIPRTGGSESQSLNDWMRETFPAHYNPGSFTGGSRTGGTTGGTTAGGGGSQPWVNYAMPQEGAQGLRYTQEQIEQMAGGGKQYSWDPNSGVPYDTWAANMGKLGLATTPKGS